MVCKDVHQYHHFMCKYKFMLIIFDFNPTCKEIVNFISDSYDFECIYDHNGHVLTNFTSCTRVYLVKKKKNFFGIP